MFRTSAEPRRGQAALEAVSTCPGSVASRRRAQTGPWSVRGHCCRPLHWAELVRAPQRPVIGRGMCPSPSWQPMPPFELAVALGDLVLAERGGANGAVTAESGHIRQPATRSPKAGQSRARG